MRLTDELYDIADALHSTNAIRGRQLRDYAAKIAYLIDALTRERDNARAELAGLQSHMVRANETISALSSKATLAAIAAAGFTELAASIREHGQPAPGKPEEKP